MAEFLGKFAQSEVFLGVAHSAVWGGALHRTIKRKAREQRSS